MATDKTYRIKPPVWTTEHGTLHFLRYANRSGFFCVSDGGHLGWCISNETGCGGRIGYKTIDEAKNAAEEQYFVIVSADLQEAPS